MSLYCATGGVEVDLFPRLKVLLAESLAKLGRRRYHGKLRCEVESGK